MSVKKKVYVNVNFKKPHDSVSKNDYMSINQ